MSDWLDLRFLLNMARETVSNPQMGAEDVLRRAPDRAILWHAFALTLVLSILLGEIVGMILGPPEAGPLAGFSPLSLGFLQGVFLYLAIHAITQIGRAFGGTGAFEGALALVTWLQFIFLIVQALQLMLILIVPPLALIVSILSIGLFFWLLSNFIAVLHGFASVGMVFVMTFLSFIGILFALSVVLTLFGISLPSGTPT